MIEETNKKSAWGLVVVVGILMIWTGLLMIREYRLDSMSIVSTPPKTIIVPEEPSQQLQPSPSQSSLGQTSQISDGCRVTGCSGQVCSDHDVATTCEYRSDYGCYRNAVCERQSNGMCGFTETETLARCLSGNGQVK